MFWCACLHAGKKHFHIRKHFTYFPFKYATNCLRRRTRRSELPISVRDSTICSLLHSNIILGLKLMHSKWMHDDSLNLEEMDLSKNVRARDTWQQWRKESHISVCWEFFDVERSIGWSLCKIWQLANISLWTRHICIDLIEQSFWIVDVALKICASYLYGVSKNSLTLFDRNYIDINLIIFTDNLFEIMAILNFQDLLVTNLFLKYFFKID